MLPVIKCSAIEKCAVLLAEQRVSPWPGVMDREGEADVGQSSDFSILLRLC